MSRYSYSFARSLKSIYLWSLFTVATHFFGNPFSCIPSKLLYSDTTLECDSTVAVCSTCAISVSELSGSDNKKPTTSIIQIITTIGPKITTIGAKASTNGSNLCFVKKQGRFLLFLDKHWNSSTAFVDFVPFFCFISCFM